MITAYVLNKALKEIESAKRQFLSEVPSASLENFVLVGIDTEYIYFNVTMRSISEQEKKDLKEKTRFQTLSETEITYPIYKTEFKMGIM